MDGRAEALMAELQGFLSQGGPVMLLLALASVLLWTCLLEHRLYLRRLLPQLRARAGALAQRPPDERSSDRLGDRLDSWPDGWNDALRRMTLSQGMRQMQRSLPLAKTLVVVCPLLGLLGTVLGMIQVFETMALLGNPQPGALSAGIARAVLTTMAGLVVALPAMYMVSRTERRIAFIEHRLYLDSVGSGASP
jgi:biopolymer transport protein ExbB